MANIEEEIYPNGFSVFQQLKKFRQYFQVQSLVAFIIVLFSDTSAKVSLFIKYNTSFR